MTDTPKPLYWMGSSLWMTMMATRTVRFIR